MLHEKSDYIHILFLKWDDLPDPSESISFLARVYIQGTYHTIIDDIAFSQFQKY